MGERRGVYRVLVGKMERKTPLGRSRCRWEDNIKTDLSGSGMWGIGLGWLRIER
jgi:3-oxoacyl-ACP reductase-like protein